SLGWAVLVILISIMDPSQFAFIHHTTKVPPMQQPFLQAYTFSAIKCPARASAQGDERRLCQERRAEGEGVVVGAELGIVPAGVVLLREAGADPVEEGRDVAAEHREILRAHVAPGEHQ